MTQRARRPAKGASIYCGKIAGSSTGLGEAGGGIIDLMDDACGSPPLYRLTDVPEFQLEEVSFAVGAGNSQEA